MTGRAPDVERLRGVLDDVNDAVILQDMHGTITYVNRRAEELYGRRASDAVGIHIADLVDDGDRSRYHAMMELLQRHGEWSGRIDNTDASGRQFFVEVRITVLRDAHGHPDAVFSMASDVTSRVELEERLARVQRLESIGELSGGVAHDFNNLLGVILGIGEQLADDLRRQPPPDGLDLADLAELADQVVTAALRGSKLTNRLLTFARRQTLQPELLDVAELIDGMDELIRRSLTGSIEVTLVHGDDAALVLADPVQLESAIINLAVNARDAMPDGGGLRIETSVVALDLAGSHRPDAVAAALPDGTYVRIAVVDTGHGMSERVRANAFDPFFTTKAPGRGTGLGLSMIHGFAQQSGGSVDIASTGPDGTVVEILLPLATEHERPSADQTLRGTTRRGSDGGGTVLVVDDEEGIRAQTRRVLERAGYRVIEAADGRAAIDQIRDEPRLDLVLTDLVMPGGIDGLAVADAVATMRSGVPVLLMSGFATDTLSGGAPTRPLLAKPFRRDELLDTVHWALGQQPGTGVKR